MEILQNRLMPLNTIRISRLDVKDKRQIVVDYLTTFGKKLDNKQLDILLSKRESNIPLYLVIACEELRVFGIHERVVHYVKVSPYLYFNANYVLDPSRKFKWAY